MAYDDRLKDIKFIEWANQIRAKYDYTCQLCIKKGSAISAHHLNSWDVFIEERYDLNNGIALCRSCHEQFHHVYGFGHNTKFQFREFQQLLQKIKRLAEKNHELGTKISK